ncbi:hypothetical protein CKO12_03300 [Chromatium okenii]|uniref:M48 family metallopeptidase n=1 Tax=Chromatium okenii TaxID=61644 RepID=UPI001907651B|nr:M48 family metallopeptidase [Chromatium okenii]MBK1640919.1 hypothetical protein [Chromatium okenii]
MKQLITGALVMIAVHLVGCRTMTAGDMMGTASGVLAATSITDAQMMQEAEAATATLDQNNKLAPASGKYQKRVKTLAKNLQNVNGVPLNIKVYMTKDINAFAMANGTIRVYSGLMDAMNDDELLFIIGHEIGHVAKGHTKQRMRTALLTQVGRDVITKTGSEQVAALTASQLGDFTEKVINAQFSQKNEREADDYGLEVLKQSGRNPLGAVTALEKLASMGSSNSTFVAQMLSTHPEPGARAERIRKAL